MPKFHKVIKGNLYEYSMTWIAVAGKGGKGSKKTELDEPRGIFVDTKFDTYVADCGNNRIQKFSLGKIDGITIVGSESFVHYSYSLSCPTAIILDAESSLFIVDSHNHRIIRTADDDIRCIIGCDGFSTKSTQLLFPFSLSFDSLGNLFVMDTGNNRIQKFEYLKNSCSKF